MPWIVDWVFGPYFGGLASCGLRLPEFGVIFFYLVYRKLVKIAKRAKFSFFIFFTICTIHSVFDCAVTACVCKAGGSCTCCWQG